MRANRAQTFTAGVLGGALTLGAFNMAHASGRTTINACVNKSTGAMRYLSKGRCTSNETSLSWNVIGPQGVDGLQGPRGDNGPAGPMGLPGATGATGPIGPIGVAGVTGMTGAVGATGLAGPAGVTGLAGPSGAIGLQGPAGDTGPRGEPGPKGDTGPAGPKGGIEYIPESTIPRAAIDIGPTAIEPSEADYTIIYSTPPLTVGMICSNGTRFNPYWAYTFGVRAPTGSTVIGPAVDRLWNGNADSTMRRLKDSSQYYKGEIDKPIDLKIIGASISAIINLEVHNDDINFCTARGTVQLSVT